MSGRTVRVEMCKVFGSPWERSPATFSPFLSFTNFGRPPVLMVLMLMMMMVAMLV